MCYTRCSKLKNNKLPRLPSLPCLMNKVEKKIDLSSSNLEERHIKTSSSFPHQFLRNSKKSWESITQFGTLYSTSYFDFFPHTTFFLANKMCYDILHNYVPHEVRKIFQESMGIPSKNEKKDIFLFLLRLQPTAVFLASSEIVCYFASRVGSSKKADLKRISIGIKREGKEIFLLFLLPPCWKSILYIC